MSGGIARKWRSRVYANYIYTTMASSTSTFQIAAHQDDKQLFQGESHASAYKQYRPKYEKTEIIEKIMTFLKEKLDPPFDCVLDLGCGSGQSSQLLLPHFVKVIGVDCSDAQIKEALNSPCLKNITFRCGDERNLGFIPDKSLELVSCGQSIHWMDLDTLYAEVDRTLKPRGCLAAYGYVTRTVHVTDGETTLERQLQDLYKEIDGWTLPYYSKSLEVLFGGYVNLPVPYSDQKRVSDMKFYTDVTVDGILGLVESFSPFQTAIKKFPEKSNILGEYRQKFLNCISKVSDNPESYQMKLSFDLFLVMSRKP